MRIDHAAALGFCLALIAGAPAARAQASRTGAENTAAEYDAGVAAFDGGHFDTALEHFRRARELSGSPNAMLYVARSLERLGRLAEAVEAYDTTVRDAAARASTESRYAPTRNAAAAALARLHDRVASVRLRIASPPPDLVVSVGNRRVERTNWDSPVYVDPGTVGITAHAAGYDDFSTSLAMAGGSSAAVSIELRPARGEHADGQRAAARTAAPASLVDSGESESHGLRTAGIAGVALGAVAFVGAGVFWALSGTQYATLQQCAEPGPHTGCPTDVQGAIAQGQTYDTLTNVGWIAGSVLAAAGVALIIADVASPRRSVAVGVGPGTVLVRGTF